MSCIIDDAIKEYERLNGDDPSVIKRLKEYKAEIQVEVSKPTDTSKAGTPEFDKLPEYKVGQRTMTVAAIGSRETPIEVQKQMYTVGSYLAKIGYTLQSGGANGADKAFQGAAQPWEKADGTKAGSKEFTSSKANVKAWAKYGNGDNVVNKNFKVFVANDANDRTRKIATEIHPALNKMKESIYNKWVDKVGEEKANEYAMGAVNLQARNTFQIFGANLDTPVDFVVFYAAEGSGIRPAGGTGQAVEMARLKGIPTINMAEEGWQDKLKSAIKGNPVTNSSTAGTYEVSTKGDKRFSALNAKLKDGRTIEEAYQLDVKGYRSKGNDWKLGKGKPPLDTTVDTQKEYTKLWEQFLRENPLLYSEIANIVKSGKVLTDGFAKKGGVNQADTITNIVNSGVLEDKKDQEIKPTSYVSNVEKEIRTLVKALSSGKGKNIGGGYTKNSKETRDGYKESELDEDIAKGTFERGLKQDSIRDSITFSPSVTRYRGSTLQDAVDEYYTDQKNHKRSIKDIRDKMEVLLVELDRIKGDSYSAELLGVEFTGTEDGPLIPGYRAEVENIKDKIEC